MRLTNGERNALDLLEDGAELTQAIPGGWWIGIHQLGGQIGWSLLRKALVREVHSSPQEDYFIYEINDRGSHILIDADEVEWLR